MIADDTILLTGLHGDDYPARVAFDDFDDAGTPALRRHADPGRARGVAHRGAPGRHARRRLLGRPASAEADEAAADAAAYAALLRSAA